jgi:hypothetical protein
MDNVHYPSAVLEKAFKYRQQKLMLLTGSHAEVVCLPLNTANIIVLKLMWAQVKSYCDMTAERENSGKTRCSHC